MGPKHIPTKSTHFYVYFVQQQNDNSTQQRHSNGAGVTKNVHSFTDLIWWWIFKLHALWRPPFVHLSNEISTRALFWFYFWTAPKNRCENFQLCSQVSSATYKHSFSLSLSYTLLIMLIKWRVDRSESEFTASDEASSNRAPNTSTKQSMVSILGIKIYTSHRVLVYAILVQRGSNSHYYKYKIKVWAHND